MSVKVKIKDADKGWNALVKQVVGDGQKLRVEVGIFAQPGAEEHTGSKGLTVLQVGIFNEFGLGVPERSFIRAYFDERGPELRHLATVLMRSVVDGKRTREQIANIMGLRMVAEIQKRIADRIAPENRRSTILKKGSDVPLIDTGQLRASISYRILH